jgi:capsular polysaccharide biosynthesis protein
MRKRRTMRVRLFTLHDVVFDTTVCTLHHQGDLIADAAYLTDPHERPARHERIDRVASAGADGPLIIGYNRAWEHNYYHWMAQAIPAIDTAIAASEVARPTVLLPPLGPRQLESLRLLGHAHARYLSVAPHQRVLLRACQYSELLNGSTAFEVSMSARRSFERLAAAARAEVGEAALIYVARTDAEHRRMRNEDALIALLERLGFRTIVPGALSTAEQIATFRAARMVIGPHGAGMTNIAFCRPGAVVYELLPRGYPNACMNRLAQSGSLHYAADLFDNVDDGLPPWRAGWTVDLARVEQATVELLRLLK